METIIIPIQPHFAGHYELEYDGKYVTLSGRDKNYPLPVFYPDQPVEYSVMILVPCLVEVRDANPRITKVDDDFIYVTLKP